MKFIGAFYNGNLVSLSIWDRGYIQSDIKYEYVDSSIKSAVTTFNNIQLSSTITYPVSSINKGSYAYHKVDIYPSLVVGVGKVYSVNINTAKTNLKSVITVPFTIKSAETTSNSIEVFPTPSVLISANSPLVSMHYCALSIYNQVLLNAKSNTFSRSKVSAQTVATNSFALDDYVTSVSKCSVFANALVFVGGVSIATVYERISAETIDTQEVVVDCLSSDFNVIKVSFADILGVVISNYSATVSNAISIETFPPLHFAPIARSTTYSDALLSQWVRWFDIEDNLDGTKNLYIFQTFSGYSQPSEGELSLSWQ